MSRGEGNGFRLPRNVRPISYDITLEPDLENFTFHGRETITLDAQKMTREVMLNAADLKIESAYISQWNGWITKRHRAAVVIDKDNERVTLKIDHDLRPDRASIEIVFSGIINDNLAGFYRAKYTLPDGTEQYMATTQFEAIDARRAFPCFDEPDLKSKFKLTLIIPKDKTAISNMPVESESEAPDGKLLRFAKSPLMSTYLLAFIVGDFECVEGRTKNGTLIRAFATPGKKAQCQFALETGIKILEWQEEYFGIPYPLPKLDMAAIPDFAAGAMENWGLVTFRENALLLDSKNSSIYMKQTVAGYIGHEFAHMWFGNLVTMKWWDNLWLNESFATWLCSKTLAALFPEWKEWENFYANTTSAGLAMDSLKSTHPVEVPIENPKEINQIFDAISYDKGASLIRMLENYLGEDNFRNGIRLYLNRHAYGNAVTEDLWAALNEVSGQDIAGMMNTWTKQPGYPVVDARTYAQKRFTYIPQNSEQSWQIPIKTIQCASGTKVNASQTGFYRVQYSQEMLIALYPAMESRELPTLDRIGLLDDTYALQRAGIIPATQYLELAGHYRDETEYSVWSNLCSGLGGIIGRLANEPYYSELEKFARTLLDRIYNNLWWDGLPGESDRQVFLRSLILSHVGYYGHRDVIKECKRRFAQFIENPKTKTLNPNLCEVVYNIAAMYGSSKTYKSLCALYRKAQSQEEKSRYLYAMSHRRNKKDLKTMLRFSLSKEVRSQDAVRAIAYVAANPKGMDMAWEFIQKNWRELESRYSEGISFMLSRLVEMTAGFDTAERKQYIENFFAAHPVPAATMALQRALEQIDINIAWLERNREQVGEWLKNHNRP